MTKSPVVLTLLLTASACVTSRDATEPRLTRTPESYGPVSFAHCFTFGNTVHLLGGYRVNEAMSMFNSSGISYSIDAKSWRLWPMADGPPPKNNFAAVQGMQGIYLFGGQEQGVAGTRDFFVYRPDVGKWEPAPRSDRLRPRSSPSLTASGEWLTLFGGKTADHHNNWGVYNERSRSWKVYGNYTADRTSHIAVSLGRRVLVWGGFEDQKRTKEGVILDPANGDVKVLASMPFLEARANAKAVSEGEKVWIIGGVGDKGSRTDGAAYDDAYQSWQYIPPLPEPDRKDFAITLIPEVGILLWGGRDARGRVVTKNYLLNLETRTWREAVLPAQPAMRIAHCLGTTTDDIYIFGGLTDVPGQGQSLSDELWLLPTSSLSLRD